jgi:DNA anti-recombination protein RmuC
MNKKENCTSTFESESLCEEKVSDEKMLNLLKLVYYERKSIKQSAKYLKLDYNTSKKIIKNFRKNKIRLEEKYEDQLENLINGIKKSKEELTENKEENENQEFQKIKNLSEEISKMDSLLKNLNSEIMSNQKVLSKLVNSTFCAMYYLKNGFKF